MKNLFSTSIRLFTAAFLFGGSSYAEPAVAPLTAVIRQVGVECKFSGDDRQKLSLTAKNKNAGPARLEIPAGTICKDSEGNRVVFLRTTQLDVPAGATSEAQIPAAALSLKNPVQAGGFEPTADQEPKLAPLLAYLATRNDVPRLTSQLIVLALLEDLNFAQWQKFLAPERTPESPEQAHPTPAEITQAIDALGVLKAIAPAQSFALASDSELKLRALRNPLCRAKAMQLYGMTIPGDAPAGAVPPDLGQLLHTKPGDNCPICRMRAQMQGPASDL